MDDEIEKRLRHDIGFIVSRLKTWPRYRREMTDLVRDCIADEIVKHLKRSKAAAPRHRLHRQSAEDMAALSARDDGLGARLHHRRDREAPEAVELALHQGAADALALNDQRA
jgi:hypothetical protein